MGFDSPKYWFKTKGEKHKGTKTKQLVEVSEEKADSIARFVEMVLTESRLEQGLDYLRGEGLPTEMTHLGVFLRWVNTDVAKEETTRLEASGLSAKEAGKAVAHAAKQWFKEKGML